MRRLIKSQLFLYNNFDLNQSFPDHPTRSSQMAFEKETEQINLNYYCITVYVRQAAYHWIFSLNNRLHCSNNVRRMLETFDCLFYQVINRNNPKISSLESPPLDWMSAHSKNAENCLQTALKHNLSDEEFKRCRQKKNEPLELDKAVHFESMKDFDIKMTYKFLRSIMEKAKVPEKNSYKKQVYALILTCEAFNEIFLHLCTKKTTDHWMFQVEILFQEYSYQIFLFCNAKFLTNR